MRRLVPGERLDHVHRFMTKSLASKMRDAGVFLPHVNCESDDRLISLGQLCCPHHVSHYLGMDVHDSSTMSRVRPLQSSMVVTNEPGLYFPSYSKVHAVVLACFVYLFFFSPQARFSERACVSVSETHCSRTLAKELAAR